MALVLADRVQETSTTTGTGTLTLAGAVSGYQTFSAGIGNGNTCYYTIQSTTGAWEVGIGTVGAGTLARTTLISSSTGGAVSFSGTLTVFVTYPAEKAVYGESTAIVAPTGALLAVANGGTGVGTLTGYVKASGTTAMTASATVPSTDVTGLGTISTQNANAVAVTGGSINATTVGASTPSTGAFTTLSSSTSFTPTAYSETIVASGTVGASATLAITAGTVLTATLTSATACTFTMPTATAGKSFTLLLKQPAAGTPTTATFTGVKWGTAGAPTITATLGRLDILAFVADGTNWYGTIVQGYTY